MEPWHDFFVAVAGASAALTGLIFVGVSLSLTRMLAIPRLADRASQAIDFTGDCIVSIVSLPRTGSLYSMAW